MLWNGVILALAMPMHKAFCMFAAMIYLDTRSHFGCNASSTTGGRTLKNFTVLALGHDDVMY